MDQGLKVTNVMERTGYGSEVRVPFWPHYLLAEQP